MKEGKEKMLKKFWNWYVGLGNAGKVAINPEPEPKPEPTPEPTPEGEKEVIKGVEYQKDEDGDYCRDGIKVLGVDKTPFYNRSRESSRKLSEAETTHQQTIADLRTEHREDLEALKTPALEDDTQFDEGTGLTKGQLKGLDARTQNIIAQAVQKGQVQTLNLLADERIERQIDKLSQSPKWKGFFEKYGDEIREDSKKLTLDTALQPKIVEQLAELKAGKHLDELTKGAEEKGRKSANEQREIVGEIELGTSAGVSAGKTVKVTEVVRQLAKDSGMSLEKAAEVVAKRDANLAKLAKGGK